MDGLNAYGRSKKLPEAAACEFLKDNKEGEFQLSTVNPVYVFGPQLLDEDVTENFNTSCEATNV